MTSIQHTHHLATSSNHPETPQRRQRSSAAPIPHASSSSSSSSSSPPELSAATGVTTAKRPDLTTFDSLQDLLEQAGYKETRVITPMSSDVLRHMTARSEMPDVEGFATPPTPLGGAPAKRAKASTFGRSAGRRTALGSLANAVAAQSREDDKPAPKLVKKKSSWLSFIWSDAAKGQEERVDAGSQQQPQTTSPWTDDADDAENVQPSTARTPERRPRASLAGKGTPSTPVRVNLRGRPSPVRSPGRGVKLAGNSASRPAYRSANLWMGSLRYRQSSTTLQRVGPATVAGDRKSSAASTSMKAAPSTTSGVPARVRSRPSLVDAFGPISTSDDVVVTPFADMSDAERRRVASERRKARDEWRESISSLKAFARANGNDSIVDPSPSPDIEATARVDAEADGLLASGSETLVKPLLDSPVSTPSIPTVVVTDLFCSPAEPVTSTDDAVALRNEGCLIPHGLGSSSGAGGMRKMRSVEALRMAQKKMGLRSTASEANISVVDEDSRSVVSEEPASFGAPREDSNDSLLSALLGAKTTTTFSSEDAPGQEGDSDAVEAQQQNLSSPPPTPQPVAPILVLTSPTGQSSPRPLSLASGEFEPMSFSPLAPLRIAPKGSRTADELKKRMPKHRKGVVAAVADGKEEQKKKASRVEELKRGSAASTSRAETPDEAGDAGIVVIKPVPIAAAVPSSAKTTDDATPASTSLPRRKLSGRASIEALRKEVQERGGVEGVKPAKGSKPVAVKDREDDPFSFGVDENVDSTAVVEAREVPGRVPSPKMGSRASPEKSKSKTSVGRADGKKVLSIRGAAARATPAPTKGVLTASTAQPRSSSSPATAAAAASAANDKSTRGRNRSVTPLGPSDGVEVKIPKQSGSNSSHPHAHAHGQRERGAGTRSATWTAPLSRARSASEAGSEGSDFSSTSLTMSEASVSAARSGGGGGKREEFIAQAKGLKAEQFRPHFSTHASSDQTKPLRGQESSTDVLSVSSEGEGESAESVTHSGDEALSTVRKPTRRGKRGSGKVAAALKAKKRAEREGEEITAALAAGSTRTLDQDQDQGQGQSADERA